MKPAGVQNGAMNNLKQEIAVVAARMVVEEGLEFVLAKRRALKQMGLPPRTQLPADDEIEREVADYVAIFCAETQPVELRALRELALEWMRRLGSPFARTLPGCFGAERQRAIPTFIYSCFVMTPIS